MDKSKWDCHDWRDWLDFQSEDSVVTELQCQYNQLAQQVELLRRAEEVVRLATDIRHGNMVEDVLKLHSKAQALLPDLETALEKVKWQRYFLV